MFIQNVLLVFFCLGVISCVFPWFLVAVGPLVLLFAVLHSLSRVFIRELKRLDNMTMSPFLSHITSSIQGLSTLQAYNRGHDFLHRSEEEEPRETDQHPVSRSHFACFQVPGPSGPEPGSFLPVQLCHALAGSAARRDQRGSDQHHGADDGPDARPDTSCLRWTGHLLRSPGRYLEDRLLRVELVMDVCPRPDLTLHNVTRPDPTRPDQTRPDPTRPDQAKSDQT